MVGRARKGVEGKREGEGEGKEDDGAAPAPAPDGEPSRRRLFLA